MNRLGLAKLSFKISKKIGELNLSGMYKKERIITSPQTRQVTLKNDTSKKFLNFCANNYLGFCNHPEILNAAKLFVDRYGAGLSSVRFICGTQDIHKILEQNIASFHGREDAIAYISCFDANAAIFEALLEPGDVIISDRLNHASIIDGIKMSKAKKVVFEHRDMNDLENKLIENRDANTIMIASDGVFSMDGTVAPLREICELADKYGAVTFIDECHATGVFGKTGKGTEEYTSMMGRVDLINSTLGKALGGACGGYTTGPKIIIDWLRQKSRPYLFSNTIPPPVVGASIKAIELIANSHELLYKLQKNTKKFRSSMKELGFTVLGDDHPICPVMMPSEKVALEFADKLLEHGIYVVNFTYPVVPIGKARIRVQISASHSEEDIDYCIKAFSSVTEALSVI